MSEFKIKITATVAIEASCAKWLHGFKLAANRLGGGTVGIATQGMEQGARSSGPSLLGEAATGSKGLPKGSQLKIET